MNLNGYEKTSKQMAKPREILILRSRFFLCSYFLLLFFLITIFPVNTCMSSSVNAEVIDCPTSVYSMELPYEISSSSEVRLPVSITLGDLNGRNDIGSYSYSGKIFNANQELVASIPRFSLEQNNSENAVEWSQEILLKASGNAVLKTPTAGRYYLFIYRVENGKETVLPFCCEVNSSKFSCRKDPITSFYICEDKDALRAHPENWLESGKCSEEWCCCCACAGGAKNSFFVKEWNERSPHRGSHDSERLRIIPANTAIEAIPFISHNYSEVNETVVNKTNIRETEDKKPLLLIFLFLALLLILLVVVKRKTK